MEDMQKISEQLSALRKAHEEGNITLEKKLHTELDKQEEKNQAKLKELSEKAAKAEELEEKLSSLEADLKRGNFSGQELNEKREEVKSFEQFLKYGKDVKSYRPAEEVKYLRTDNDASGGYLAPSEYINEIIKNITEISPVRQFARVITTSKKEVEIPRRTGLVSGGWVGEAGSATESNSTYGIEKIGTGKMAVYTDITTEMIDDTDFNMRSEISSDTAEDFAKLEGAAFINGDGVNKPEGLLTNSSVGEYNSGDASKLTADSLFEIQGEIKSGYTLAWMFNRKTLHQHIRTLKDGNGDYLLSMGLGDLPNTVAGVPYVLANDMPDVSAGNFPILIGDYRRAYYIVDNRQIRVLEDPFSQGLEDKKRFIFHKRTGGQVVLPEAVKKLKIAA